MSRRGGRKREPEDFYSVDEVLDMVKAQPMTPWEVFRFFPPPCLAVAGAAGLAVGLTFAASPADAAVEPDSRTWAAAPVAGGPRG